MYLNEKWEKIVKKLDFAFQPIVNINNGEIVAVEALLRNYKEAGFNFIFDVFDEAYHTNMLYQLDLALREKAIKKFKEISFNIKLFYNLDNRIINSADLTPNNTVKILSSLGLQKEVLCFEISERATLDDPASLTNLVHRYKFEGFNLAIDDFGTGIAGLKMLYYAEVDFLKIDRFFITDIQNDTKKQLFIKSITNLAHIMGIKVIAEGIESKCEYYLCKELDIDFIQGYFIQKPTINTNEIQKIYENINTLAKNDKRKKESITDEIIQYIEPINYKAPLIDLITMFKEKKLNFIPVVDNTNTFVGIIEEESIKELLYSPYGLYIAQNKDRKIDKYIKNTSSIEKSWSIEKLLEIYTTYNQDSSGIIVTNGGKYLGFINNNTIINLAYKRNLELAKDQNPLTKLPGNTQIEEFINKALESEERYYLVYFDFDNFKPFNDKYGFRKGDRAILLFATILKKHIKNGFIGHIGGDDFFVGFKNLEIEEVVKIIHKIQKKFKKDVIEFYDEKDKKRGYIIAKDRFGVEREFKFLTVSSFIIEAYKPVKKENFDFVLGVLKKAAKLNDYPLAISILP